MITEALGVRVAVSLFTSIRDNGKRGFYRDVNHIVPWQEWTTMLCSYSEKDYPHKTAAPLFVPTVFNGTRKKDNASVSGMAVIDADGGLLLDDVVAFLDEQQLEAICYTSASNRTGDRFRIIVPFAELVTAEEHKLGLEAICRWLTPSGWTPTEQMLKAGKETWYDPSKTTSYSMFYVSGQYDEADNRFVHLKGLVLSASEWLEVSPAPATDIPASKQKELKPSPNKRSTQNKFDRQSDLDAATLMDIVEHLPSLYADEFDDWNRVGMALWSATDGSSEGLEFFDYFSRHSSKYDPTAVRKRWDGYSRSRPTHLTVGTLIHLAKEGGWRPHKPKVSSRLYGPGKGTQIWEEFVSGIGNGSVKQAAGSGPKNMGELIEFLIFKEHATGN
jgi:hypothetical protein